MCCGDADVKEEGPIALGSIAKVKVMSAATRSTTMGGDTCALDYDDPSLCPFLKASDVGPCTRHSSWSLNCRVLVLVSLCAYRLLLSM